MTHKNMSVSCCTSKLRTRYSGQAILLIMYIMHGQYLTASIQCVNDLKRYGVCKFNSVAMHRP